MTIDFAGHIFTTKLDLFDVKDGGTLSLTSSVVGGKLVANSNQGGPVALIQVEKGGTLNINNGIEIDLSKQFEIYYPLYGVINYGTVNMNGGKIVERNGVAITCMSTGSFTMAGGEIVLISDLRDANTIGFDRAVAVCGDYAYGGTCGQITLNAGTFSGEGCAVTKYDHTLTQGANFNNNVVTKGSQD